MNDPNFLGFLMAYCVYAIAVIIIAALCLVAIAVIIRNMP